MKLSVEPITGEFTVNGYRVGREVIAAILDSDPRILWRFIRRDGEIQAVPYTEKQIIWIDPE